MKPALCKNQVKYHTSVERNFGTLCDINDFLNMELIDGLSL